MCDPVTIGLTATAISTVATVASTATQAAGQQFQAESTAQTHFANAQLLDKQGEARQQKAEFDKETAERDFLRTRGRQKAAAASSGFSTMSFSDIFADSDAEARLEQGAIQFTADHETSQLQYQGDSERSRAGNARIAGGIDTFGTVLKGASRVAASFSGGGGINVGSAYSGFK